MQDRQDREIYEDVIDFREIFSELWTRKWLIMGIAFLAVLIAVLYSYTHPKIYKVSMVIEPGIVDISADGKYVYLDSPDNIKAKIESNAYLSRIGKIMQLKPDDLDIRIEANIPKNSNIIKAYSEFPADKAQFGVRLMQQLLAELQVDYARDLERKKDEFDKQILMRQNQIKDIEIQRKDLDKKISIKKSLMTEKKAQIDLLKGSFSIYEQREKDLMQDLKEVKNNAEKLILQRDELLKQDPSKKDGTGVANLMYSTTVQQNVSFFNELKNQLNQQKIEKENQKSYLKALEKDVEELRFETERLQLEQTEALQSQINAIQIDIKDLQNKVKHIQNIKTISEPAVSHRPIKPRPVRNIVLALFGGLLLGVIFVLFSQYIIKK
jgi:uncharacterized protein involved in exopolysaccharide biosynthesis